jgi:hypothetical protein
MAERLSSLMWTVSAGLAAARSGGQLYCSAPERAADEVAGFGGAYLRARAVEHSRFARPNVAVTRTS